MQGKEKGVGRRIKVLFILHQASLTGAPIILCELAWALLRSGAYEGRFLVMEQGPLFNRCRSIAESDLWFVENRDRQFKRWGFAGKLISQVYYAWRHRRILKSVRDTDVILSNTIANGAILKRLSVMDCPVISYIHELPFAIRAVTTPETLGQVIQHTNYFLAGSEAVRMHLVKGLKVDRNVTEVLYSSLSTSWFTDDFRQTWQKRFRMDHLLRDDVTIVGVSCTAEWRKGFDLWMPLVQLYFCRYPNNKVVFVWKGYKGTMDSLYVDLFDIRKTGLDEAVIVLPHDAESKQVIAAFDIHLLLSREDPYPLVVLEAACMGIPTVCFSGAGGAPEFVEDDAGISVPYGDLSAMADALNHLVTQQQLRSRLGAQAKAKVADRHDVDQAALQLSVVIHKVIGVSNSVEAPKLAPGLTGNVNSEIFA
jgi:glycosyltransferase involved in cell wall biosynthesis